MLTPYQEIIYYLQAALTWLQPADGAVIVVGANAALWYGFVAIKFPEFDQFVSNQHLQVTLLHFVPQHHDLCRVWIDALRFNSNCKISCERSLDKASGSFTSAVCCMQNSHLFVFTLTEITISS